MTYGKEEIGYVVGYVDSYSHVCEVEAVAQANQGQSNNVVEHQLLVIFPRRLELEQQDQPLLQPVRCLQEIVRLEPGIMRTVWEALVHARNVKVPHRRPTHHVQSQRAKEGKVHGGVELFHEAVLLRFLPNPTAGRNGSDDPLHQELAGEGEDDGVEGHKGEVLRSFAILCRIADVWRKGGRSLDERRVGIGKEDGVVEGVLLAWVDEVGGEEDGEESEGEDPGVLEAEPPVPP